ncbi:MAG: response regulator [Gammaproteobacteria bacterium]|nr:MAG: response regulator [Gammaproteobacteria bacterium]
MKDILLVDDEPHVIRVMRLSLERAGYTVRQAGNGEQALQEIRNTQPDMLITDIDMPRMTGKELCLTIAQEMPDRSFGIYVLTSRTAQEHREWSAQLPRLRFMEKPVSIRQLLVDLEQEFTEQIVPEGLWKIVR